MGRSITVLPHIRKNSFGAWIFFITPAIKDAKMIQLISTSIMLILLILIISLRFLDKAKKRNTGIFPSISFIIPCYNDADSVTETVDSIYGVVGKHADVVVIDDCSNDNSREILEELQKVYRFTFAQNMRNIGKTATLNSHSHLARNKIICFVDADVIVNKRSFVDALARLRGERVGAVSCPYASRNKGFLPLMQHIEYNMVSFIQGSYNLFSAIHLWGGFIVIKRKAFLDAGKFSLNAITEDKDLAFKLNEKGWKVEQSPYPVESYAPDTCKDWVKQKIRWASGGAQCYFKHWKIWIRNPLHIIFLFSFCAFMTLSVVTRFEGIILWDHVVDYFKYLNGKLSLTASLKLIWLVYGAHILRDLLMKLTFTVFSLPFVLPLIRSFRRSFLLILIVPFSVLYMPLFSLVSVAGIIYLLCNMRTLKVAERAW